MLEGPGKTGSFDKKRMFLTGRLYRENTQAEPGRTTNLPSKELSEYLSKQREIYGNVKQYDIFSKLFMWANYILVRSIW